MKIKTIFLGGVIYAILFFSPHKISAQRIDIDQILKANLKDANTYFQKYMSSIARDYGRTGGEGWNNSATALEKFQIEIGVGVNGTAMENKNRYFHFSSRDYGNNLRLSDLPNDKVPTLEGNHSWNGYDPIPKIHYIRELYTPNETQKIEGEFTVPKGYDIKESFGVGVAPLSYIKLSMGVLPQTELKFRFSPWLGSESWRTSNWGIGVMHNLSEWFEEPDQEELPFLDFSVYMGYQWIHNEWRLAENDIQTSGSHVVSLKSYIFNFHLIASKKLNSYFSLFGILGYDNYSSVARLKGKYTPFPVLEESQSMSNPLKHSFIGGVIRVSLGVNIEYKNCNLYTNYSYNERHSIALGLSYQFYTDKK